MMPEAAVMGMRHLGYPEELERRMTDFRTARLAVFVTVLPSSPLPMRETSPRGVRR